jgi:glycosyltransferase involved in cell wall biosynthesis
VRLIYFTRDYSPHDERFLKVLSESSHEVFLLRLEGESLESRKIDLPEKIKELAWKSSLESRKNRKIEELKEEIAAIFLEAKPDLVHAGPLPDCAYLAALSGFQPLVAMSWGFDLMQDVDQSVELWNNAHLALKASGSLLVDCQASAKKAIGMGFSEDKIVNFPWGVELGYFSPGDGTELRNKLGWENDFILLCNRAWEPRYGVDVVLKAFFQAHNEKSNLRLLLVGDGSLAGEFDAMIAGSGAGKWIHKPGKISLQELPDYYRAADIFVSASHVDGSSVSLLEAMACGLPVAVSDIPANQEWVEDGTNGWVFREGDADRLAQIFVQSSDATFQLGEMSRQNRQLVERKADWQKNSVQLFDAYDIALESAR